MKCSIMLHFIWFLTVCKNTHLRVPEYENVKRGKANIHQQRTFSPQLRMVDESIRDITLTEYFILPFVTCRLVYYMYMFCLLWELETHFSKSLAQGPELQCLHRVKKDLS